ncbi:MAG: PAS domain-containing protein [Bacteroidota bacterium]
MKAFANMKLAQRIQLTIITLMVVLFALAGLTLNYFSRTRTINNAIKEANTYIDRLIDITNLVEQKTGKGLSSNDLFELKPYFAKPAFNRTDFPAIISKNGEYLLHATRQGARLPLKTVQEIKTLKSNEGYLTYHDVTNDITEERILVYKYYKPFNAYFTISVSPTEVLDQVKTNRRVMIIIVILASLMSALVISLLLKPITKQLAHLSVRLKQLAQGEIPTNVKVTDKSELGNLAESLNGLIAGLKSTTEFARQIEQNKLDFEFKPLSKNDQLGMALLQMRESLKRAQQEEAKRKEEDNIRTWINAGLAKFGDILRQNNNNLNLLADNVIQNLVNYLDANQGGIFMFKDYESEKYLELLSAFAYNRKKFLQKTIMLGEGLVGTCAVEKQTIYLKEIPSDYIAITSGLGEATPTSLLIVPLKLEDEIFGVIEIASFNEFAPYQIEFVEKVSESIAATLNSVKNNIRTRELLEQSQQQREEMAAQEEEMRQNMEEMQATQEEMQRKNLELEIITSAINQSLVSCSLNDDGYIIDSNIVLQEMTGFSKIELEGKLLESLIVESQREEFNKLWKSVLNGQSISTTLHLTGNNGRELYLLATLTPGFDPMGLLIKIFLVGHDITEAKKLELMTQQQAKEIEKNIKRIKEEQEISSQRQHEMETLLKALDQNCLVSIIEPDGLITYINNKNVEVLGDQKEDIENHYLQDIDYTAKNKPKEFERFWKSLHKGIKQTREFSLNVKGETRWVIENFTPIMDESGNLYKIINIALDITENKKKEEELNRIIEQLKQQLKK